MSLGLAIPMFNEEGNVERVLNRTMSHLQNEGIDFTIAAINNGSSDGTGLILDNLSEHEPRIIPIHLTKNQGYGGGILAGMRTLLLQEHEVIGWTWGDGQICATVLSKLYKECTLGADLAKACRIQRQDGYTRRLITKVYAQTMWGTFRTRTTDINGCPKLFRRDFYQRLELQSTDWFLDAETILKTEKHKGVIHQEPVIMEPRASGVSKVGLYTLGEFMRNIVRWKCKRY